MSWVVLLVRDQQGRQLFAAHDAAQRVLHSLAEARQTVLRNDDPRGALVQGVVDVSGSALSLLCEVRGADLVVTVSAGVDVPHFAIPLDRPSVSRDVLRSGQPLQVADIHQAGVMPEALTALEALIGFKLHSVAYVPIEVDSQVVGLITAAFGVHDIGLANQAIAILSLLGKEAALAIEREGLLSELNRLSVEDPLTGLTNRRGWNRALAGLGRQGAWP